MDNRNARHVLKSHKSKTTTSDNTSSDEKLKVRRERNRASQQIFRKRRRAAEAGLLQRAQRLEDVIENMSLLFIELFDEVLHDKQIVKSHPELLAMFQSSASRLKTLVEPVINTDDRDTSSSMESLQVESLQNKDQAHGDYSNHRGALEDQRAITTPESDLRDNNKDQPCIPIDGTANALGYGIDFIAVETASSGKSFIQEQNASVTTIMDSFSLQLLETTLSQACLVLDGRMSVPSAEVQRIFGTTLRFRTPEQQLAHMRWLLGSDISQKRLAAGVLNHDSPGGFHGSTQQEQREKCSPGPDLLTTTNLACGHENAPELPMGFLTAVDIQERLRELGAKASGPDTLEIRIGGQASHVTNVTGFDSGLSGFGPPLSADLGSLSSLTLHVKVSLLITNLAHSATCFTTGPAYSQVGFSKAVEKSLVSFYDDSFAISF